MEWVSEGEVRCDGGQGSLYSFLLGCTIAGEQEPTSRLPTLTPNRREENNAWEDPKM